MMLQREPVAALLGLATSFLYLFSAMVLPLSDEQQGVLNALLVTLAGVVSAFMVGKLDRALPLLAGLVQAVISVGLAFGMELDPTAQSAIMGVVAAVVALLTRVQVTPKVAATVHTAVS